MLVPFLLVVILAWISDGSGGNVVHYRYGTQEVRIGSFASPTLKEDPVTLIKSCALECFAQQPEIAQELIRRIDQSINKTVLELNEMYGFVDEKESFRRSIAWQTVKHAKVLEPHEEEAWSQLGMVIWPRNHAALNNFAFFLEYSGHFELAKHLFADCYTITGSAGCHLFGLAASPLILRSEQQAEYIYVHKLAEYYHFFLQRPSRVVPYNDVRSAYDSFREIPVNLHYQGFYPGILMELFSKSLVSYYPRLEDAYIPLPRPSPLVVSPSSRVIRVGIMSEYFGNTSPGLCMEDVLVNLPRAFPRIHQVFFDRTFQGTTFAVQLAAASHDVVSLTGVNLTTDIDLVRTAHLDVLVYIALGTEKQSYLLAHARLAAVQVLVGVGHPLSPGLRSIDYVVLPATMLADPTAVSRDVWTDPVHCAMLAAHCLSSSSSSSSLLGGEYDRMAEPQAPSWLHHCALPPSCYAVGRGLPYHAEQVVVFDSAAHFLREPHGLLPYPSPAWDAVTRVTASYGSRGDASPPLPLDCAAMHDRLAAWGLLPALSVEDVGCLSHARRRRLYLHLHYLKKMHPRLDALLVGIAQADRQARILVPRGFHTAVLPRLVQAVEPSTAALLADVFVEVPRLPHADYLILVGMADVMLNAAPYGAGITSSEALGMCTPVVVWPQTAATIHFALSQLRRMGLEALLAARGLEDAVALAVHVARNNVTEVCARIAGETHSALRDDCLRHGHVKSLVCAARDKLFGVQALEETVWEWRRFLLRIADAV